MKSNIVIPLCGKGQRMIDGGYDLPKPLLFAGNKRIIEWSIDSIDYSESHLIFVVRKDHCFNYGIDSFLRNKYPQCTIVKTGEETSGAIESVLKASIHIDNDIPLVVYCPDVYFEPKFSPSDKYFEPEGYILTFKANSPAYSYVDHINGVVQRVVEKQVVSDSASVGIYCFKTGKLFCEVADKTRSGWEYKERFVAPLYNYLSYTKCEQVETIYIMGTPSELDFFKKHCFKYLTDRLIVVCSDHSGFDEKEKFVEILKKNEVQFVDVGCYSKKDCDYVEYVKEACNFIKTGNYLGVGFCRSGQGVNLCANKNGAIGVIVRDLNDAKLGILHNFADFFSVSAGKNSLDYQQFLDIILKDRPEGGRFQNRVMKI